MKIILGSSSPFRKELFSRIAENFDSMSPDIDEKAIRSDDPKELVLKIAHAKADALVKRITEPSILVTADQVAIFKNDIREKPESEEEARKFIQSYAGNEAAVLNGIVVTNTATGKRAEGTERASISYDASLVNDIDPIIDDSNWKKSSGAFLSENPYMKKHEVKRDGNEDSFFGIPIKLTKRLIDEVQN